MIKFNRSKFSDCNNCPLCDERRVYGQCETDKPSFALIGEAPGAKEQEQGKPFVGPAGKVLMHGLSHSGIRPAKVYFTNTISCRPPNNNISSEEALIAIECCGPGLKEEIKWLTKELKITVLGTLGKTASNALGVETSITKSRGSVYLYNDIPIVPTYHPSFIMRGQYKEEPTWFADFQKIQRLSYSTYKPPKENFNLFPSIKELEDFLNLVLETDPIIAADIETTSLRPNGGRIIVTSFAIDEETCISFPVLKKSGYECWVNGDRKKVKEIFKQILENGKFAFQNALFDATFLEYHGYPVKHIVDDTLLAHHCISPELKHNLGYIVSVYGKTPYWKEEFLNREGSALKMEDKTLRTYNCRDSVVIHQVLPELKKELKELGSYDIYKDISVKLIPVVKEMILTGIQFSESRQSKWKVELTGELKTTEFLLRKEAQVPDNFNVASADDLRALIFNQAPSKYNRAVRTLKAYEEPNCKLKKQTKKYQEALRIKKTFETLKPLHQVKMKHTKTGTKKYSTEDKAFERIKLKAHNRLKAIEKLKRKQSRHLLEETGLKRIIKVLTLVKKYREYAKLISTYTNFKPWADGRVHGSYKIQGTATGRLSSQDPNMQNLPKAARKSFITKKDHDFINADFKNLELYVLAYLTDEPFMINMIEKNLNIHDENTKLFFGIDKDHPLWTTYRNAEKMVVFGTNYGGTYKGIYDRLMVKIPELDLNFTQFSILMDNYFSKLPKYAEWSKDIKEQLINNRKLKNAFGRTRYFLGKESEIIREGMNFPVQCLSFGTRVLTSDLNWEYVQHLSVGDRLIAFDEEKTRCGGHPGFRRWRYATVTNAQHDEEECFKIMFDDGSFVVCTAEHKWLIQPVNPKSNGYRWCRTDKLKIGKHKIPHIFKVWDAGYDVDSGYLAGAFDCDGTLYQTGTHTVNKFCQMENVVQSEVERILAEKGFAYNTNICSKEDYEWVTTYIKGGIPEQLRFLGQIRPKRLLRKLNLLNMAKRFSNTGKKQRKVVGIEPVGKTMIVRIATDTKTFFAEGMPTHNSTAADIMNLAMIGVYKELKEQGLKAKLIGTVHDSLMSEAPKEETKQVCKIFKKHMTKELTINRKPRLFRVDFEVGPGWGELKEYEV